VRVHSARRTESLIAFLLRAFFASVGWLTRPAPRTASLSRVVSVVAHLNAEQCIERVLALVRCRKNSR
jgi:hypothetical protein